MEALFKEFIKKENTEIEVRFGTFGSRFVPGIKKDQFDRIFTFLLNNKKFYDYVSSEEKIENIGTTRKITKNGKVTFNKKNKIKNIDVKEWGFRFSVSTETPGVPVSTTFIYK
jgi:hypothetical protein